MKVLFVLKLRHTSGGYGLSSGLYNSARFVADMLTSNGIQTHLVQVIDNNSIDHAIYAYEPDVVIVEAFWVVPEKFDVLKRLHPRVKFVVRNHSETAFLAQEGIAVAWTLEYLKRGVYVAPNSYSMTADTHTFVHAAGNSTSHILRLPNYYPIERRKLSPIPRPQHVINIGCFGAIRPMKNQLEQAIAAIKFGANHCLKVRFHINASRVEDGNGVLKNLRMLFKYSPHADLVEHEWMDHPTFTRLLASMDVNLCVSFSESFCIVAADSVSAGVPTVGSPAVHWLSRFSQVDPNSAWALCKGIEVALRWPILRKFNRNNLAKYSAASQRHWLDVLKSLESGHAEAGTNTPVG